MTSHRSDHLANIVIYSALCVLASASAALPLYVHLHPSQFGPPLMTFNGASESRFVPLQPEHERIAAAVLRPKLQLDRITTGSIQPPLNNTRPRVTQVLPQPLPDAKKSSGETVRFIAASRDRALAVVDGRLRVFSRGERLPDGQLIGGFEHVGGVIRPMSTDTEKSREKSRNH